MAEEEIIDEPQVADAPQEPVSQPDPPSKKLYDKLSQAQLYTKSFDDFQKKYSTPEAITELHSKLNGAGYYTKSKDDFQNQYFAPVTPPKPVAPVLQENRSAILPVNSRQREQAENKQLTQHIFDNMPQDVTNKLQSDFQKQQYELKDKAQKGRETLTEEINNSAPAVKNVIRREKSDADLATLANPQQSKGSDATSNIKLQQYVRTMLPQTTKVNDDEIAGVIHAAQEDSPTMRKVLKEHMKLNPQKAKDIQEAMYAADANAAGRANSQVADNLQKIKEGKRVYDVEKQAVIEPVSGWEAVKAGRDETHNELNEYNRLSEMNDQQTAHDLETQYKGHNFDEPIKVPDGMLAEGGHFIGREIMGMGKAAIPGMVAGTLTEMIPGLQAAGPEVGSLVGAAAASPEFYKRGWINSLKSNYAKERDKGLPIDEAYAKAKERADFDAKADVVTNAAMSMVGLRGLKAKGVNWSDGFKNILEKNIKPFAKETAKEAGVIGGIGAASQVAKNVHSGEEWDKDALGAGLHAAALVVGLKAITGTASGLLKSKKDNVIAQDNFAKQPDEVIHPVIGEAILNKEITPEQGKQALETIEKQREINSQIGDEVKGDATRVKIQNRLEKIESLKEEAKLADKDTKEGINLQIEKAKKEIQEFKDSAPETENDHPIQKAIDEGIIKGGNAYMAEHALQTKEGTEQYLKDVSDQALNKIAPDAANDAHNMQAAIENYGQDVVDLAIKKYPKEEPKPRVTVSTPSVVNIRYKNGKMPFEDFKSEAMNMAVGMKDSKFEHRLDIPKMSQEQREGAVKDIKAGKNTPRAAKFEAAIKDMHERGVVSVVRGRGNHVEHADIPFKDWFGEPEAHKIIGEAENITPELAHDVESQGININNIDNFKHLFNETGFPYHTDDFAAVKEYLSETSKRNASTESISEGSKGEKETIKNNSDALQEPSAGSVLQHPQDGTGIEGGERQRMESSQQGNEITGTQEQAIGNEKAQEEVGDKKATGIKNAVSNDLRTERTLPTVEVPKLGKDVETIQDGKRLVDSGEINPRQVVNRILEKKEGMQPNEAKAMQYYMHQLSQHETNLREEHAAATTPEAKAQVSGKLQQLSDEVDAATQANIISGTAWSHVGNIRQIVTDQSFNPSREKTFIKDAYGGEMPKEVQAKFDVITKERDEAIAAKAKVEEELKQKMAAAGFEKVKERAKRTAKNQETKEVLKKEEQDLIAKLKKAIKKDTGNLNAGIPIPKETLEVLGKLAINYVKQGVNSLEALVDRIHANLDEPDISKKQIRDFLAEHDPLTTETETNRLNRKSELLQDKITPTTIKTKNGEPAGVSEPTNFNKPTKTQKTFRNNTEWVKAQQRVANAEFKIKVLKRKAFESEKNMYQKGLAWAGRLTRLSVLSGYSVLGKLASAATIGSALKRIPEQAIGALYQKIFKGISEKAPIEGGINIKAEMKFYKEFFNPKKFVHNAWEILKTGSSDLGKRLGSAEYEHVPGLYLPTDMHQIIKDPPKRATFEASRENLLNWSERNGLDTNDDLVNNSIDNLAYKRAQYEIFQEQNWLSRKFTSWKSKMEKQGNVGATSKLVADFLIPVSTVPTNIVRRIGVTSPVGLVRGGAQIIDAYRKGIENLKPEQADKIMMQLKQGTLGTALWMVGWYGYENFGGLYSKFNPDKKRREGDLVHDEMEVGGKMLPKPVQHALPLEIIQFAATARRIFDNYRENKKESTPESLFNAGMGSIGALAEQIPVIETGVHLMEAAKDPYQAKKFKEDMMRRIKPQILRETGVIPKDKKNESKNKNLERR